MRNTLITVGVFGAAAVACSGGLETHDGHPRDEPAGAAGASDVLLEGTVYWGPTTDEPVDRAFVRFVDSASNMRCVVTGCDGKFSMRFSRAVLGLPYRVSIERWTEPEAKSSSAIAIATMTGCSGRDGRRRRVSRRAVGAR